VEGSEEEDSFGLGLLKCVFFVFTSTWASKCKPVDSFKYSRMILEHKREESFSEFLNKWDEGSSKSLKLGNLVYHLYHKTRIFLFWPKKFFCRFYEFLKNFGLAQKKSLNRNWL
jgi:hypothetical protein